MRRLYRSLCRRWCPGGMTLSALAWDRAQRGSPFWRDRIDGAALLLFSDHNHCQAQFQKERR
jgi:hypothetical protein